MVVINPRYTIDRQGKTYALYSGVLDAAHAAGLLGIETTLVQIPGPENGHVAVCTARVRLVDANGVERTFTGIGDADASNVNRAMATALIRVAETRAKARALRDAINVAEALAHDETTGAAEPLDAVPAPQGTAPRPAKEASAKEWHGWLSEVARARGVEVPRSALMLAVDAGDDEATRKNGELAKALRAAGVLK